MSQHEASTAGERHDGNEESSCTSFRELLNKMINSVGTMVNVSSTKEKLSAGKVPGLKDLFLNSIENSDPESKMKYNSKAQALLLQHGKIWGGTMKALYLEDLQAMATTKPDGRFSALHTFFRTRMEKLGPTFCAFGHVVLTSHSDVAKQILLPQKRWDRVYPGVFMKKDFVDDGRLFTLFLDSKELGGNGEYELLREAFKNIMNNEGVHKRLNSEIAQGLIKKVVEDMAKPGVDMKKILFRFAVDYAHYIVLDMDLKQPEFAALVDDKALTFLCNIGRVENHWISRSWPLNAWGITEKIAARKLKEVQKIYEKSPIIQNSLPHGFPRPISISVWAVTLIDVMTLAAIIGILLEAGTLLKSKFPVPSPDDEQGLRDSVFEHCRWDPPVPFTCLRSAGEFHATINGEDMTFPDNTPVAVGVGLTGYDASVFPDPETFNPENTRRCPFSTSFNWVGDQGGPRSCVGRHIAERMGKEILIAKFNLQAKLKAAAEDAVYTSSTTAA